MSGGLTRSLPRLGAGPRAREEALWRSGGSGPSRSKKRVDREEPDLLAGDLLDMVEELVVALLGRRLTSAERKHLCLGLTVDPKSAQRSACTALLLSGDRLSGAQSIGLRTGDQGHQSRVLTGRHH